MKSKSNPVKPTINKDGLVDGTHKPTSKAYMVAWRAENKERVKAINHRYYMRNKGYLNKTRSRPWNKENIIKWIINGEQEYLDMMIRVTRPHKDKLIGLDELLNNKDENKSN